MNRFRPLVFGLVCCCVYPVLNAANARILDCTLNGESVNPSNGSTTAGKTGLMRCTDRGGSDVVREEALRDGKFIGVKRWFEQGKLAREYHVNERGNRDGRAREWNAQGVLIREEFYANGGNTGLHRQWYPSGKLRIASFWADPPRSGGSPDSRMEFTEDGKLAELQCGAEPRLDNEAKLCGFNGGAATAELFSRGRVAARVTHDRGKRIKEETYWDDGKLRSSDEVKDAQRISRSFAQDGVKRKETVREQGKRVLEQEFSERGTLMREQRWSDGLLVREAQWYLNGQPRTVLMYESVNEARGQRVTEQQFHDNGKLAAEGRYVRVDAYRTEPVGTHKFFDEGGRLRRESTFDERGRIKRERMWDADGKLARDEEVFEDGSRKSFAKD